MRAALGGLLFSLLYSQHDHSSVLLLGYYSVQHSLSLNWAFLGYSLISLPRRVFFFAQSLFCWLDLGCEWVVCCDRKVVPCVFIKKKKEGFWQSIYMPDFKRFLTLWVCETKLKTLWTVAFADSSPGLKVSAGSTQFPLQLSLIFIKALSASAFH